MPGVFELPHRKNREFRTGQSRENESPKPFAISGLLMLNRITNNVTNNRMMKRRLAIQWAATLWFLERGGL